MAAQSPGAFGPLGYQRIASLSSATALTVPTGAVRALVIAETQAVRWRDDGTNPTSTVGMPLPTNTPYTFERIDVLPSLKFIEQTASAVLHISYYG